ncbi:hypothetical protein [Paenibacillus chungangensis]|uniref:Uncharacterized protein n=1 Tax=Paenibacillus chungangensis TaxID=696535 RepID=A0ABW3HPF5_9BACL
MSDNQKFEKDSSAPISRRTLLASAGMAGAALAAGGFFGNSAWGAPEGKEHPLASRLCGEDGACPIVFPDVAAMKAYEGAAGEVYITISYVEGAGYGGATYLNRGSDWPQVADGFGNHTDASGNYLELLEEDGIRHIDRYGADPTGANDSWAAIQHVLTNLQGHVTGCGDYSVSKPLVIRSATKLSGPIASTLSSPASTGSFTIRKIGNATVDGADAVLVFGQEGDSVKGIRCVVIEDVSLDSSSEAAYGMWCGRRSSFSISQAEFTRVTIRNCTNGIWLDNSWLVTYNKVSMGAGASPGVGFYSGYFNSTSNHYYGCYTNSVAISYWVNSTYSSINGCASDGASEVAYRIGNMVSINDCGAEFCKIAVQPYYTTKPVQVNNLLVICRGDGTTLVKNYFDNGSGVQTGSAVFYNCTFSANTAAKAALVTYDLYAVEAKQETVQFIDSYVTTYVPASNSSVFTNVWAYTKLVDATNNHVALHYGPHKKGIIVADSVLASDTNRYLLTRFRHDGTYVLTLERPESDVPNNGANPFDRTLQVKFILSGGKVALVNESRFDAVQQVTFWQRATHDNYVYVQIKLRGASAPATIQKIEGPGAETRYALSIYETPSNYTQIMPAMPIA